MLDRASEDIRVLLTDVALSQEMQAEPFQIIRLAREGKLHGVEVVLSAQGEPLSGSLFLDVFNGMTSVSGVHRFEQTVLEREGIGGRLFMDGAANLRWRHLPVRRDLHRRQSQAAHARADGSGACQPTCVGGSRPRPRDSPPAGTIPCNAHERIRSVVPAS